MEIPRKKINKEMELGVHQRENTIRDESWRHPTRKSIKEFSFDYPKRKTIRKLEPGAPQKKKKKVELEVSQKENQ